jgi:hypothetical protein
VWKKQRAFRQKRAEKIADHKLKSGVNGWPGTNPSTFAIAPGAPGTNPSFFSRENCRPQAPLRQQRSAWY